MAEKRMFSRSIIDSDVFLDMPGSTQNLYFHLNMRADDEGFIDRPKAIMRAISAAQNDLDLLIAKSYLLGFESGVVVIRHWKLHNTIRRDRYTDTFCKVEKELIKLENDKTYQFSYPGLPTISKTPTGNHLPTSDNHCLSHDNQPATNRQPTEKRKIDKPLPQKELIISGNQPATIRHQSGNADIGLGLVISKKEKYIKEKVEENTDFDIFWNAYPRKVGKGAALKAWVKSQPPLEVCLDTIDAWTDSKQWTADGGQFIPHPATWLNRSGWEDETPAESSDYNAFDGEVNFEV